MPHQTHSRRTAVVAVLAIGGLAVTATLAVAPPPPPSQNSPTSPSSPQPSPAPASSPPPTDSAARAAPASTSAPSPAPLPPPALTADELLSKLETADKDLRTLTAAMQYVKVFPDAQGGERHTRRGTLAFLNLDPGLATGKPRRKFSVTFTKLFVGSTVRDESRSYVFDGTVLTERDETAKQFFKRTVVAKGSSADPMRIGEGPLPLPIGQRRADITARFEAVTVSPLESVPDEPKFAKLRALLGECHQLKLSPKPGTPQARDYQSIRLWYRTSDFLPIFSQSTTADGSKHEIFLLDLVRNEPIADSVFSTASPDARDGWTIDVSEFRESKPAPAPEARPIGDPSGLTPNSTPSPAAPNDSKSPDSKSPDAKSPDPKPTSPTEPSTTGGGNPSEPPKR